MKIIITGTAADVRGFMEDFGYRFSTELKDGWASLCCCIRGFMLNYSHKSNLVLGLGFKDIDEKSSLSPFVTFIYLISVFFRNICDELRCI